MSKTFGNGRYQVIDKLGSGGMAVVYKAQDTLLNRIVTVKVLREQFASDEDFSKRFRREAQAVASLSHSNIVSVYDVGKDEEQEYIVMEFVDGKNLKEYIKENAPLPVEEAIDIAKQICDALAHAHKQGIIHRDIKPHNILLTADGRAKVTDFGIARAASAATVTHTGTIVGSVHYFSPEQARGDITNEQSDIYSLGIILYEMVTGQLPYDGESPITIALKHMNSEPAKPSEINPLVKENFEQVILRAIAKYPEERYKDTKQLKEDLQRVEKGMSTAPFTPGRRVEDNEMTQVMKPLKDGKEPGGKKKQRKLKPLAWAAIAALALALIFGTYYSVVAFMRVDVVEMPDLANLSVQEAYQKLEVAKLQMTANNVHFEPNNSVEEGKIFRQDPEPGAKIKVNHPNITVWVSQGPEKAAMPDLVGKKVDLETALNMIARAGFSEEPKIEYQKDDSAAPNTVISQSPAPNTQYPKAGPITLTVTQAPDAVKIKMPDVVGKTQDEAMTTLDKEKLTIVTEPKQSTVYPKGYVVESTPKAGVEILQGSEVKLIISSGPGPTPKILSAQEITDILRTLDIPRDDKPHQVLMKLKDYRGLFQIGPFAYQPDMPFDQDIQYNSPATLQIFVDDRSVPYTKEY